MAKFQKTKALKMRCYFFWAIVLLLVFPFSVSAQLESFENLEEATKDGFFKTYFTDMFKGFTDFGDPLTMSGGIGLNMRSYSNSGGQQRQDPFFYSLNTNLNVRVYKISIPFSMILTARNKTSSLPNFGELADAFKNNIRDNIEGQRDRFVRFGMSPHYKWMKLHLGHRSMNLSKFTLSNLNFFGTGTELNPGNIRFAAMYGRLAKAEPIDLSLNTPNLPIYQRKGWGTKIGYGTEQDFVDLIVFGAKDDANSIDIPLNYPSQPSPQSNLTFGLNIQKQFADRFRFRLESGLSMISANINDEAVADDQNTAFDASLDYEGENFVAGFKFKRIDPNYKSFGAFFFNNDLVEYSANVGFGLMEDKANVNLSVGIQSNNISLLKSTTTSRLIYSGDLSYALEAFSANANYSNNSTDIGYVLNPELDSLNAVIISQNAGLNFNYSITGNERMQHTFTLSGNLQEVSDDIDNPLESAKSQMMVAHFIYNLMFPESKTRITARVNYNQNELAQMLIKRSGFGFGVSQSLLEDKMNAGIDINFFNNSNALSDNSTNLNTQLRLGYNISDDLNLNWNMGFLRTSKDNSDTFKEFTGNLGIQYNFNVNPFAKNE
ncbi:MAG: hypothetical protein V3V00_06305 [Saprospiraceae bacterium]